MFQNIKRIAILVCCLFGFFVGVCPLILYETVFCPTYPPHHHHHHITQMVMCESHMGVSRPHTHVVVADVCKNAFYTRRRFAAIRRVLAIASLACYTLVAVAWYVVGRRWLGLWCALENFCKRCRCVYAHLMFTHVGVHGEHDPCFSTFPEFQQTTCVVVVVTKLRASSTWKARAQFALQL